MKSVKAFIFLFIILPQYFFSIEAMSKVSQSKPNPNKYFLLGEDVNQNGLREDIRNYININYSSKYLRMALYEYGKAYQEALVNSNSKEHSLKSRERIDKSRDCLLYITRSEACGGNLTDKQKVSFEDFKKCNKDRVMKVMGRYSEIKKALTAEIINTEERLKAYLKYDKNLSGGMFKLTPMDKLHLSCKFIRPNPAYKPSPKLEKRSKMQVQRDGYRRPKRDMKAIHKSVSCYTYIDNVLQYCDELIGPTKISIKRIKRGCKLKKTGFEGKHSTVYRIDSVCSRLKAIHECKAINGLHLTPSVVFYKGVQQYYINQKKRICQNRFYQWIDY